MPKAPVQAFHLPVLKHNTPKPPLSPNAQMILVQWLRVTSTPAFSSV